METQEVVEACHAGELIIKVELFQLGGLDLSDFFPPHTAESRMGSTWGFPRGTSSRSSSKLLKDNCSFAFIVCGALVFEIVMHFSLEHVISRLAMVASGSQQMGRGMNA